MPPKVKNEAAKGSKITGRQIEAIISQSKGATGTQQQESQAGPASRQTTAKGSENDKYQLGKSQKHFIIFKTIL